MRINSIKGNVNKSECVYLSLLKAIQLTNCCLPLIYLMPYHMQCPIIKQSEIITDQCYVAHTFIGHISLYFSLQFVIEIFFLKIYYLDV